jgi:NADPH2:quinone reductase
VTDQAATMKAWRVCAHGRPTAALRLDTIPVPEPGPRQVRVRSTAAALNFNEVDGCHGRYITVDPPMPYTLGMEVLGVVDAAGEGTEQWLGRRVMATALNAYGAYAEWVIAPVDMVFEAPAVLSDTEAAAFFFPFHLAWLGLHTRGALQHGETVLVHAGAGGVGSAAIQLAAAAGARVIATAGSPEKVATCLGLGADVAIDYRADDFAAAVLEATDGRGVDLVFDGVGGEVTAASTRCTARGGRILMIGFASGIEAEDEAIVTPRSLLFGSLSLVGVMLAYSSGDAGLNPAPGVHLTPRDIGEGVQSSLESLLVAGKIRPVIGRVVDFGELPEALETLENRETIGRTILRIP